VSLEKVRGSETTTGTSKMRVHSRTTAPMATEGITGEEF
jgi:hypothetical protein